MFVHIMFSSFMIIVAIAMLALCYSTISHATPVGHVNTKELLHATCTMLTTNVMLWGFAVYML